MNEVGKGYLVERCCGRLLRWHEVTGPSGRLPCEQKALAALLEARAKDDTWPYDGLSLTRLKDGRVMCCICFEYKTKDQLATDSVDGKLTDTCKGDCAKQAGVKEAT